MHDQQFNSMISYFPQKIIYAQIKEDFETLRRKPFLQVLKIQGLWGRKEISIPELKICCFSFLGFAACTFKKAVVDLYSKYI